IVYNVTGDTLTAFVDTGPAGLDAGDRVVFTLQVLANGNYTFTLKDQLDHLPNVPANDDNQTRTIDFSSLIQFTDFDQTTITLPGGFSVTIEDDIPVQNFSASVSGFVDEDELTGLSTGNPDGDGVGTIATGSLTNLVLVGADEPGSFSLRTDTSSLPQNLTSKGAAIVYNVTGDTLTAFVDTGPAGLDAGDRVVFT